jgi:pepF/M3 family oligoendopeptidase
MSIYPSFDALSYKRDIESLKYRIGVLLETLEKPFPRDAQELLSMIRLYEEAGNLAENLEAYTEAVYTTDTRNPRALMEINVLEAATLPLKKAAVMFRTGLAKHKDRIMARFDPALELYYFFITESLEKAAFQMTPELEDLANDLSRSGGNAWTRLHEAISSTASAVWDPVKGERKTAIALRDLAHHPERALRERAYKAELAAWKSVELPLAAALNGVKGTATTLDKRRGWKSALHKSCFQSRIQEKTQNVLIAALEKSLPLFRQYLSIKARLLGLTTCAFYDLFAPVSTAGTEARKWTWRESADFIVNQFNAFDTGMGAFARAAFDGSWIDAEPREGKVGGAYCTSFPLAGVSRILCNFEGSFDSVITVAHELGHAWHHELIKSLPRNLRQYPMTLAETASIFAETVVFEGALRQAPAEERLGIIEGNLSGSCQVVVDILSRFYFEQALFERRDRKELSPDELCAMMLEAQQKTYGKGLDPKQLHPYMWAVKSHYYNHGLGFYNYPYAFGLLFSLSLYGMTETMGADFQVLYRDLLLYTGKASAEQVARIAGFDIQNEGFWQHGIDIIASRVKELERSSM